MANLSATRVAEMLNDLDDYEIEVNTVTEIHIESTSKGYNDFRNKQLEVESKLKRSENCICGHLIALSIQTGIGNPKNVYAWGCPNCDPQQ